MAGMMVASPAWPEKSIYAVLNSRIGLLNAENFTYDLLV